MSCAGYKFSRRAMLGTAAGTFLGLHVRQLVALAGTSHAPTAESVILFWNGGGMSHIDTFDPKPGRPSAGKFEPIQTSVPGTTISEIFPLLAKQMHHVALVRSIAGTQGDHGRATYQLQTSYNQSSNLRHPGLGSVVVHEREPVGDLPAYISISGEAPRAGYLGQKCEAYFIAQPGQKDPYVAFPAQITQVRGNQRLDILAKMNRRFGEQTPDAQFDASTTSVDEAVKLMRSPALSAFELDEVKPAIRDRYGDTEFGRGALLARRLGEKGVRFVQVNRGGFDTHVRNFPAMEDHGEIMDPALAALIADLAASGMLAKTLVMVLSEFGRTPRINKDAGRDHHASCFSTLLAGGGLRGGVVIGSSDKDGAEPADRPVEVPDLHATVCHALGIDPNKEVMTPLQRKVKLIDGGKPIAELF